MVRHIDKVIGSTTNPSSQEQEQCDSTIQTRKKTLIGKETEADGLSLIWRSLSNKGISPETQATILNSWRSGTQKQYRVFLRPALRRYRATWDISVVFAYLKTFCPVEEITLQQLTHKLVMLCALVTGQRSQSLHLMSLATLQKKNGSYVFHIDQLVKQSRPNRDQPTLVIPRFLSNPRLCVASTLEEYIEHTAHIRKNENQLFISVIRQHH